ncbi:DNA polymerase Y family protein [Schaalia suimastitidis]|uniref:DNA polymerase Y family protein n=1 Tax=Schaalia suimastitidis TaxID=121163 RepID=UPI000428B542|nr:DNA polymerase Y family protein [Schaalia suimastitidis]
MRRIALWIPDWPVNALVIDSPPSSPVALVAKGRIVRESTYARKTGIRTGMRLTTARYLCPDLIILPNDPDREGKAFEYVLQCFDRHAAYVASLRPGLAWAPATGAARWCGGEEILAETLIDDISTHLGIESYVGIATGPIAAIAAAKKGMIIPPCDTQHFLAKENLKELLSFIPGQRTEYLHHTLDTLALLGIHSCEDLRTIDRKDLLGRFGNAGQTLLALAHGQEIPLGRTERTYDCHEVTRDCDQAACSIEEILFPLRQAAVELADALTGRGLGSHSLTITLTTENGEEHTRLWHGVDARNTDTVIERARWQIRAWLDATHITAGLCRITLCATDLSATEETRRLWGENAPQKRAHQAVSKIYSLLGEDTVLTPFLQGGYDPRSRIICHPWGKGKPPLLPIDGQWQGSVELSPATLYENAPEIQLLGKETPSADPGRALPHLFPLHVSARGELNGAAHLIRAATKDSSLPDPYTSLQELEVIDTRGPWPVLGAWWTTKESRAYLQVKCTNGAEFLLKYQDRTWYLEGIYTHGTICGQLS